MPYSDWSTHTVFDTPLPKLMHSSDYKPPLLAITEKYKCQPGVKTQEKAIRFYRRVKIEIFVGQTENQSLPDTLWCLHRSAHMTDDAWFCSCWVMSGLSVPPNVIEGDQTAVL